MPFLLDGNPTQGELSEAVNYLLSNFSQSVTADPSTGQIIGPGGDVQSYLYKYMYIKYATSFDGSVGFSNVPTNATYYGLRNTDDPTESTNPADYVWTKVSPSFGTTYFLYYLTTGGRSIQFQEATSVPNPGWEIDPGTAIDLDFVTNVTNTPANFVVIRVANNSAAPTNAEVLSAIGRLPIDGDLCTVNYNSGLYSLTFKYTTGWAIFQKYITGDLIVAQSIVGNNIAANTITAGNIAANTITAGQIAANTITAGQIAANTITAGQIAANTITAGQIAAATITAGNMNVATLSAISVNLGSINAGSININGGTAVINSDGSAYFDNITIVRQLSVATGTASALSGSYAIVAADGWKKLASTTVDTGYVVGAWWNATDRTYSMSAGVNNGSITAHTTGGVGYVANWAVIVRDIYPKSRWSSSATIIADLELWAEVDAQVYQLDFPASSWALFKVT